LQRFWDSIALFGSIFDMARRFVFPFLSAIAGGVPHALCCIDQGVNRGMPVVARNKLNGACLTPLHFFPGAIFLSLASQQRL